MYIYSVVCMYVHIIILLGVCIYTNMYVCKHPLQMVVEGVGSVDVRDGYQREGVWLTD